MSSKQKKKKDNKKAKWFVKYGLEVAFLIIFIILSLPLFMSMLEQKPTLSHKEFIQAIEDGKVEYITVEKSSDSIYVHFKDGKDYRTINLGYEEELKDLVEKGVEDIRIKQTSGLDVFSSLVSVFVSLLFFYVVIKYFIKALSSFKNVAETNQVENKSLVTFKDIAGMSEEKEELMSAIMSLKKGAELKEKGMRPIKGVLLEGPPGVGKTLLAKAIAGEAGVNFLSYSGAGFSEMFMGVGAMRVKAMFRRALEMKPCVVFIDEIDSVGSRRSGRDDSGSKDLNNTLTALLERMDGISSEDGILFIGATNRLHALDEAILRPGRFDKIIHVGPPKTKEDREAIIEVHLRNKKLKEGVTIEKIGKLCFGLTGAQIESVLNDAVMESMKAGDDGIIDLPHVDKAVMKLLSRGIAKGSHKGKDLKRVAVHEVGHALMNTILGRKVVKVSVQPYSSGVGGVTLVDGDSSGSYSLRTREELIGDIKVLYAGMVAEKVVLGDYSTGNSNDLEKATELLHKMVTTWGMVEGSILSVSYFDKVSGYATLSEKVLEKMEKLGESIKKEVEDLYSREEVKQLIISLAEKLEKDEVLYDFSVPDSIFHSLKGVSVDDVNGE